jgi:hypothetical protein
MLPSGIGTTSALCFEYISRLNTLPACASVNASLVALQLHHAHDSKPVWLGRVERWRESGFV